MTAIQYPGDRYPATLADCPIEITPVAPNVWEVGSGQSRYTHGRGLSVEYHPRRNVFTVNRFGIPVAVCTGLHSLKACVAVKLGMA